MQSNRLISNIHNFTDKFTQNNPMNIILTTNQNQADDRDGDELESETQSKDGNHS